MFYGDHVQYPMDSKFPSLLLPKNFLAELIKLHLLRNLVADMLRF
jgi:hypothetical protein